MINGLAYVYISMTFDNLEDLWSSLVDANILFADDMCIAPYLDN